MITPREFKTKVKKLLTLKMNPNGNSEVLTYLTKSHGIGDGKQYKAADLQ
jgi:hypothetical protein